MAQKLFDPNEKEKHSRPTKVAIVTTHWNEPGTKNYPKEESRYAEFEQGLRAEWIDIGRLLCRADNSPETAKEIIRSLLRSEVKDIPQRSKSFGFMKFFRSRKA
jgi:hypothetical protein